MNWFRRLAKLIGCYVRLSNAASACGFFGLGRLLCCVFCFSFLLTSCILLRAQLVAVKTGTALAGAAAAWSEVRIARARLPKMAMRTDCLSKVGWLRPALRDLQLELLVLHAVLLVLWIPRVLLDLAGSFFLSFRLSEKPRRFLSWVTRLAPCFLAGATAGGRSPVSTFRWASTGSGGGWDPSTHPELASHCPAKS